MPNKNNLFEFCENWRALTLREAAAIQSNRWAQVREIQALKNEFREDLTSITVPLDKSERARLDRLVGELVRLEKANAELLNNSKRGVRQQLDRLDSASRNLRQVHRAYQLQSGPLWASYS